MVNQVGNLLWALLRHLHGPAAAAHGTLRCADLPADRCAASGAGMAVAVCGNKESRGPGAHAAWPVKALCLQRQYVIGEPFESGEPVCIVPALTTSRIAHASAWQVDLMLAPAGLQMMAFA